MKLTRLRIDKLIELIKKGYTVHAACASAGVGRVTYYKWIKQGKADADRGSQSLQRQLFDGALDAEALHEQTHLDHIIEASTKTWQASAWYLERRYPERYGKRVVLPEQEANDEIIIIG